MPAYLCELYSTDRSGKTVSDSTAVVFSVVDGGGQQSGRELRQYLTNIADRCSATSTASSSDDGHVDAAEGVAAAAAAAAAVGGDNEVPLVIVVDGLHRITTPPPLADVFAALLHVPLNTRYSLLF